MRRKHYAIGAAVLTVGFAAVVLLQKDQTGLSRLAYLPSDILSPFSAPPAIPLPAAEVVTPAAPKAPVVVAEVPTSAPIDVPPATPRTRAAAQPDIPAASNAPSDTPFVWHGSGGRGQSWTGTGGRSAALNNGPSSFGGSGGGSGGGGGGGGGTVGSNHPLADAPSLPPSSAKPPAAPQAPAFARGGDEGDTASSMTNTITATGGTPAGGGGFTKGGTAASIVAPGGPNDGGQGFLNGPAQFASYEAPEGGEQETVTVDEPGALSILLVSALGLLAARRATKRGVV